MGADPRVAQTASASAQRNRHRAFQSNDKLAVDQKQHAATAAAKIDPDLKGCVATTSLFQSPSSAIRSSRLIAARISVSASSARRCARRVSTLSRCSRSTSTLATPIETKGRCECAMDLREIDLAKWDAQKKLWQTVARKPTTSGVRTLYGSWAAMPQLPTGTGEPSVANVKLWLWSKTPFDYTRHSGSDWDDWFTSNFPNYPCVPQEIPDREVCIDFEKLDRAQFLQSPWRSPEHPEITLSWLFPERQQVTMLDPPVDGFTHALCFPAVGSGGVFALNPPNVSDSANLPGGARPIFPNTVTITLTAPAKRVKLLVVEERRPTRFVSTFAIAKRPVSSCR